MKKYSILHVSAIILAVLFFFTGCAPTLRNKANLERLLAARTGDTTPPTILQFDAPHGYIAGGTELQIPILASDDRGSIGSFKLQYSEDGKVFTDVGEALPEATSISWTVPKTDQLQVYLKLTVTDLAGNQASQLSDPFQIDSTPPLVPEISLTSSTSTLNPKATFSAKNCDDTDSILINSGDTPLVTDTSWQKCSTTSSALQYTFTQDGNYSLYAWAKDLAGNISPKSSSSFQIKVDITAPTIASVTVHSALSIDVTLSEAMGTGVTVPANYTLSGSGKGTLASHPTSVALVSGNTYRLTWSTGEMKNGGDITITLTNAQDVMGNSSNSSATQTAGGIGTAPTAPSGLALITPASSPSNQATPTIQVSGVVSGDTISLFSDSNCTVLKASATAAGTTIQLTSSTLSQGSYTFYANSTDPAGNTSSCSTPNISYTLDTTPPTLSISVPSVGSYINNAGKTSVAISGSCSENGRTVTVSATDAGSTSVTATPNCNTSSSPNWTANLNFTTLADGAITIAASHSDSAGNLTNASSVSVTKDVLSPNLSITTPSASSYVNNAGKASVTVSGSCSENGRSVTVSATDTGSTSVSATPNCNTGSSPNWAATLNFTSLSDGTIALSATQSDAAGNSASASIINVTKDVVAPTVNLTSLTGGQIIPGGLNYNITWSASDTGFGASPIKLEYSSDSGSTWNSIIASTTNSGTYSWSVPGSINSNSYRVRAIASDLAGNSTTAASSSSFTIDSTAPTISAFTITEGASTNNNNIRVNLTASDSFTKITQFCLKYNSSTAPTLSDTCWVPVNNPSPGITPALSVSFSNYYYTIGYTSGAYSVYGWVRDEAGNISTLSSSGAGTAGTDKASITYTAASPPVISNALAVSTASPSSPPSASDQTVLANSTLYIHWVAAAGSGGTLSSQPISLSYTTDDINYTSIASSLNNGSNSGCTSYYGGSGGCYIWTPGNLPTGYFRVKVSATDVSSQTSSVSTNILNVSNAFNFIAGNVETGLNGSASSAMFFNAGGGYISDIRSLVVADNGTVYFRDIKRGILIVNPSDGVQRIFIPTTGTASGDGGPVTSATLRFPAMIALDYQNHLLIHDYDRIRRVDLSQNPPTIDTFIGGGASSADNVSPLQVSMPPLSSYTSGRTLAFFPLPNGDFYFQDYYSGTPGGGWRVRVYKSSTQKVMSVNPTGTGVYNYPSQDITACAATGFAFTFNPVDSSLTSAQLAMSYVASTCPLNGTGSSYISNLNPTTFSAQTPLFSGYPFYDFWHTKIVGRNGSLYGDYGSFTLKKFDPTNNTWTTVLGTGTIGICADGTTATSCNINLQDVFVNSSGQIFFMDNGMLRTVDPSSNKVVTLMGQSNFYGEGVSPLIARFGSVAAFDVMSNGNILVNDSNTRIREVVPSSTIQTIAGNGTLAYQNVAVSALSQGFWGGGYFKINPSTGDLFMAMSTSAGTASIFKLNYSTKMWSVIAGGGATSYASADGSLGNQISFPKAPYVVGFDGSNILSTPFNQNASQQTIDSYLKKYSITDGTQANIMGVSTVNSSAIFCSPGSSPGVSPTACTIPAPNLKLSIMSLDTYTSPNRWVALAQGNNAVLNIPTDGSNITALATIGTSAIAMDYRHDASNNIIYYCSASDTKLHKYDLNTSTDTTYSWPITGLACQAPSLVYRSSTNRIIFSYTLNGLYGIAEYVAP